MRIFYVVMLPIAAALILVSWPTPGVRAQGAQPGINWNDWDVIPGRALVTYRPAKSAALRQGQNAAPVAGLRLEHIEAPVRQATARQQGNAIGFRSLLPDTFVGEFKVTDRERILRSLAADPEVVSVEPDRRRVNHVTWGTATPNDYTAATLWGMKRIGAPAAWARQGTGRAAVRVAVMEQQFDPGHRDLRTQVSAANNNTLAVDDHATHVAGTIAATGNNNQDVVGVANVELVSLAWPTSTITFAQQVTWAVNNQVRVINMSWKSCGDDGISNNGDDCLKCVYPAPSTAEQTAITNAANTIVFVASAGNDACSLDANRAPLPVSYVGVIGVSAIDQSDTLASFSNFGTYVDLTAPGVNIRSTTRNNTTGNMDGTSMAAPHVAGSIAAILAIRPAYDMRSIPRLMQLTAQDLGTAGRDDSFGDGVVRVDWASAAIADRYAEVGGSCQTNTNGVLLQPHCDVASAISSAPTGGTVGIVRNSVYRGARIITKPISLVAVGGTVTLGP